MIQFPQWQIHRGYWQEGVRENTLKAFKQAKQLGAEMVELDVQVSSDGVPHVFHDLTLKRFFKIDEKLKSQISENLLGLNIPRLRDVLESNEVPECLNIEMKSIDLFCFGFTHLICDEIKKHGSHKKVLLSSFNPMCLFWARFFLKGVPRALIVGDAPVLHRWMFWWSVRLADPHYLNARERLIDEKASRERLLSFGLPIMVWTVNEVKKAQQYLTRGAKSIISDLPPISKL